MLFFSSLIKSIPEYKPAADRLFAALESSGTEYRLLDSTRDIWLRDFMPVRTKNGEYISFCYEPSYLTGYKDIRTDYRKDIAPLFDFPVIYSDINLDGGNVVFSPSGENVIISDRIFSENTEYKKEKLITELERLLEAKVIIIPSLKSDMTGHADGMVRFVDEKTVIGNSLPSINGLEQRIKNALKEYGITVIDFPYYYSPKDSAEGCYLNFLETDSRIFLPVFGKETDAYALRKAQELFYKKIVPVNINEIAVKGGVLNCISWETKETEYR